jgi:hypothetical protein
MINGGGRGVGRKRTQRGKPQPRMNWPQENAKVAKKKRHNLFSLSSLRSFAAKNFLELHDRGFSRMIPGCMAVPDLVKRAAEENVCLWQADNRKM